MPEPMTNLMSNKDGDAVRRLEFLANVTNTLGVRLEDAIQSIPQTAEKLIQDVSSRVLKTRHNITVTCDECNERIAARPPNCEQPSAPRPGAAPRHPTPAQSARSAVNYPSAFARYGRPR